MSDHPPPIGTLVRELLWLWYSLVRMLAAWMLTAYGLALGIADAYYGARGAVWWSVVPILVARIAVSWFREEEQDHPPAPPEPPSILAIGTFLSGSVGCTLLAIAAGLHTAVSAFGGDPVATTHGATMVHLGLGLVAAAAILFVLLAVRMARR